jgi:hypothetical protein
MGSSVLRDFPGAYIQGRYGSPSYGVVKLPKSVLGMFHVFEGQL